MGQDQTPAERWAAASDASKAQAPPEQPEEQLTEEQQAELAMAMQRMMGGGQSWRPACLVCLNNHKIAIAEISGKLASRGIAPGTPEFVEAMQAAAQAGQMLAQNPMAVLGQNGSKPDVIPPVRQADVFVNGNTLCAVCFVPQKQTSLLAAGPGWRPGA